MTMIMCLGADTPDPKTSCCFMVVLTTRVDLDLETGTIHCPNSPRNVVLQTFGDRKISNGVVIDHFYLGQNDARSLSCHYHIRSWRRFRTDGLSWCKTRNAQSFSASP